MSLFHLLPGLVLYFIWSFTEMNSIGTGLNFLVKMILFLFSLLFQYKFFTNSKKYQLFRGSPNIGGSYIKEASVNHPSKNDLHFYELTVWKVDPYLRGIFILFSPMHLLSGFLILDPLKSQIIYLTIVVVLYTLMNKLDSSLEAEVVITRELIKSTEPISSHISKEIFSQNRKKTLNQNEKKYTKDGVPTCGAKINQSSRIYQRNLKFIPPFTKTNPSFFDRLREVFS